MRMFLIVVVWLLLWGLDLPAQAHAILVESTPAGNAVLAPGPLVVHLRFNSRIDPGRSRLTLVGPEGRTRLLPLDGDQPADVLAAHVVLPAGSWRVRWQVLALDGHITRGDVAFVLTAP